MFDEIPVPFISEREQYKSDYLFLGHLNFSNQINVFLLLLFFGAKLLPSFIAFFFTRGLNTYCMLNNKYIQIKKRKESMLKCAIINHDYKLT